MSLEEIYHALQAGHLSGDVAEVCSPLPLQSRTVDSITEIFQGDPQTPVRSFFNSAFDQASLSTECKRSLLTGGNSLP